MHELPAQHWTHDGKTFKASFIVEGAAVVGMTEVTELKLLGDRIATGLSKLGVNPCGGCDNRRSLFNRVHRSARRLVGLNA